MALCTCDIVGWSAATAFSGAQFLHHNLMIGRRTTRDALAVLQWTRLVNHPHFPSLASAFDLRASPHLRRAIIGQLCRCSQRAESFGCNSQAHALRYPHPCNRSDQPLLYPTVL